MFFFSLLASVQLAHHAPEGSPYGWHMSCERFHQKAIELRLDENLDTQAKYNLLGYFRSKVENFDQCAKQVMS